MPTDTAAAGDRLALRVENLSRRYGTGCARCVGGNADVLEKNYCPHCGTVYALQDTSFALYDGEVLGIVGESGSGKSTILNCLYFDIEPTGGAAYLRAWEDGTASIFDSSSQTRRYIRNHVLGKVYQNPVHGLKMRFSSVANIAEKMIAADDRNVARMEARASELLTHVRIPRFRMKEAPENFSGGMQQRVQISKALANNPPILLLDEITSGLDVSVQARVLDLVKALQDELDITMIVVSHDMGVIRLLTDRTIVMKNGRVVEHGLTDQILEDPQHRYSQELVQSLL